MSFLVIAAPFGFAIKFELKVLKDPIKVQNKQLSDINSDDCSDLCFKI